MRQRWERFVRHEAFIIFVAIVGFLVLETIILSRSRTSLADWTIVGFVALVGFGICVLVWTDMFGIRMPWRDWSRNRYWAREAKEFAKSEAGQRLTAQLAAVKAGQQIEPPWVLYPDDEWHGPHSGCWRQGTGEYWLHEIWFPMWALLNAEERREYLDRWKAGDEWRYYLEPDVEDPFFDSVSSDSPAGHVLNVWLKEASDATLRNDDTVSRRQPSP